MIDKIINLIKKQLKGTEKNTMDASEIKTNSDFIEKLNMFEKKSLEYTMQKEAINFIEEQLSQVNALIKKDSDILKYTKSYEAQYNYTLEKLNKFEEERKKIEKNLTQYKLKNLQLKKEITNLLKKQI